MRDVHDARYALYNTWRALRCALKAQAGTDPESLHLQVLAVGLAGLALSLWLAGRRERWVIGTSPAE